MKEVDTVKGFRDFLPPESLKREALKEIIKRYYKQYGFVPVETPLIEFDELMKSDTLPSEEEDEAISERFRLQDRGKRKLGLRYEFTFQLARILKMNPNIKLPFRRYQIGENFRDEPTRTGRTRQFTQCDVDIIGDASVNADVECVSLVCDILKELKIKDFEVQINNRKLLDSIIRSVEITKVRGVMRELDKLEKSGPDEVKVQLRKYASPNQILTLFKLLDKSIEFFEQNAFDGADELNEFVDVAKKYGVKVRINPSMVRGFSYYTGNVFEVITKNKTAVIAGGRYDRAVGKYIGREIPAVGISFSLEALMGLYPEETDAVRVSPGAKVLVLSINQDGESIKLIKKLRKADVSCIFWSGKIGKALDYANALAIPYVIFVGGDEVRSKKFKFKNMESGKEQMLSEERLVNVLAK